MNKSLILVTILFTGWLLNTGCKKNEIKYGEFDVVTPDKALLKINFVSSYQSNPVIYLALNGARVSNPITSRTPFPGGGLNTGGGSTADYMVYTPGSHKLTVTIPKKAPNNGVDSIKLFETDITLEADKYQTIHITDTAAATVAVKLDDNNARPDSGNVRYKFVNLMPNVPAVDLYYAGVVVAANVAYKASAEFTMPLPAASSAWTIKPAGDPAAAVIATYTSASTITNRRVYTVFALGYRGQADNARKPYLSFLYNL